MSYLIRFELLPWIEPALGIRYKIYKNGNQQIRLAEFSDGFIEPDWCHKSHAGYVLEGSFTNDYSGKPEHYKTGDFFFIPSGEEHKHKVIMANGEKVLVLLFEIICDV